MSAWKGRGGQSGVGERNWFFALALSGVGGECWDVDITLVKY